MNEKEYLEEIKGRDGIISKLIDRRDLLLKENTDLKANLEMAKGWHSGEVDLNDKLMKENTDLKKSRDLMRKWLASAEVEIADLKAQLKHAKDQWLAKCTELHNIKELLDKDRIIEICRNIFLTNRLSIFFSHETKFKTEKDIYEAIASEIRGE